MTLSLTHLGGLHHHHQAPHPQPLALHPQSPVPAGLTSTVPTSCTPTPPCAPAPPPAPLPQTHLQLATQQPTSSPGQRKRSATANCYRSSGGRRRGRTPSRHLQGHDILQMPCKFTLTSMHQPARPAVGRRGRGGRRGRKGRKGSPHPPPAWTT